MTDEQRPVSWPVAAVLPALCLACVLGIALVGVQSYGERVLWSFGDGIEVGYGIGTGLVGLVLAVLSTVVLRHPSHRGIGWALGGTGLFWALDGLSEAYVRLGVVTDHALPGMTFAVWFLARFTSLLPATIVVLPLLFPEGRFLRGAWGLASWACMGALVLSSVSVTIAPYDQPGTSAPPGVDLDPTTVWSLRDVVEPLTGGLQVLTLLGVVVPVGVVVHRYRRSRGTERAQMRWLLWGALVTASVIALTLLLDLGGLTNLVFFLCITLVPITMTVAVVNPTLVPIEDLLGRTVVLALISLVLVGVDFLVVAGLSAVLDDEMAQSQVVLVVLLTTVLLYGPLRQRLSRGVRRAVFGDLVRQAATAERASRRAADVVSAREEERRRIRRDLHDGLGPALSGMVFQLESARLLVDKDPAAAKAQIGSTSQHVQEVVADVRRLVHDLRPPALDDRGLVGALRQQGERLTPPATVVAGELGALPAAVEVAAYRIAGEAMTNVARHAHASTCEVRLRVADGALLVEVADDGAGIPADVRAGVGLVALRERAAELGGRSEVTCPPTGGTVVRAWLPLRSAP